MNKIYTGCNLKTTELLVYALIRVCALIRSTIVIMLWRNLSGFVCVEVLWPSQPNGVMSSTVSLPNHTFTGQA